jgi:ferredoxin
MAKVPQVSVDFDKCKSNGLCEALAPEVFYLDDDDFLQFHKTELDDADLEPVRRAVASCPTGAISLVTGSDV